MRKDYSSTEEEVGDKINESLRKLQIIKTLRLVGEFETNIQILKTSGYQFCKNIVYAQDIPVLLYTIK